MLKKRNEQGYTLLIVLYVVTFIMIVSASFVTASVSNAKQEKVVDTNNMAVVAAEMGIDYYLNKMEIEEVKIAQSTLNKIEPYLNLYNTCNGNKNLPGCTSMQTIEDIRGIANDHYTKKIQDLKESFASETPTYINSEQDLLSYVLKDPDVRINGEIITIEFKSVGSSSSMPKKELLAKVDFTLPVFIADLTFDESEQGHLLPEDIFNYFASHKDYEKVNQACDSSDGKCRSGKFYSSGLKDVNNPNNKDNLVWVHEGLVNLGNMNSMGGDYTLIVESIKVDNMNSMNGKLLLIGKKNKGGQIASAISTKIETNGKLCINVDGYPKEHIQKISYEVKNGDVTQVLFYSGSENPIWPTNIKNDNQKRTGSLSKFVNECTGLDIFINNYQTAYDSPTFDIDVDYFMFGS
jgi:hypothetical protein